MSNQPLSFESQGDGPEWRMAFEVARLVKETSQSLQLAADREWLQFVLGETAENMRNAVIWAATGDPADESAPREHRRTELVVAADAARGDAVIASYCLDFMRSEELIDEELADSVRGRLNELEGRLNDLSRGLRAGEARQS